MAQALQVARKTEHDMQQLWVSCLSPCEATAHSLNVDLGRSAGARAG